MSIPVITNNQAVFDFVATKLLEQGRGSFVPAPGRYHGGNKCLYRGPNGAKCAIGHLIPDEKYTEWMDSEDFNEDNSPYNSLHNVLMEAGYSEFNINYLAALQTAHDRACRADSEAGFVTKLRSELWAVADKYYLSSEVLNRGE